MKKRKRLLALLSAAIVTFGAFFNINSTVSRAAEYWPSGVDVTAVSAIVMDQDTGTILYEKNMDEQLYPASITKIMTALVVLENCELDEKVIFSADAVFKNEGDTSHISRDLNEEMTVEETLYGMMLESANECAWALAEHCAGDVETFVGMMNKKAEELGCRNTHFNNPNGLPDEEHWTSAYDMALISRAAYSIPKFAEIVGTKNYTIQPTNKHSDPTPLNNHHNMLHAYNSRQYVYEYCLGGKTGYTTVAGSTLVTYARKNGMTLICVVMKDERNIHWVDTRNLFDYCFDNFSVYNVSENASINDTDTDVTGLLAENMDLIKIDSAGTVILPKTASFLDAKSTVEAYSDEENPSVVGKIKYSYADREIGSADLIFAKSEIASYPFDNLSVEEGGSGKDFIQVDYLKILLIALGVIAIIILLLFIRSIMPDILKSAYRFRSKHPRKVKSSLPTIDRKHGKRRKRRR